jgi:hypothetical protein
MALELLAAMLPLAFVLGLGLVAFCVGYKWGSFVAHRALKISLSKWKVYTVALFPFAVLSVVLNFHHGHDTEALAYVSFWTLSTPAVLATCFNYNKRPPFNKIASRLNF